jgi:hypothetical protein
MRAEVAVAVVVQARLWVGVLALQAQGVVDQRGVQ